MAGPRTLALCLAGLLAVALPGRDALGQLAYAAGLPGIAARLLTDPSARGAALHAAGAYADADRAFAEAGRVATYNRGLTLAATGNYALSRAYFDAVLFANPAVKNADPVASLIGLLGKWGRLGLTTASELALGSLSQSPADWQVLVDAAVLDVDVAVIGSGVRRSKVALPGALLAQLPGAEVVDGLGVPLPS